MKILLLEDDDFICEQVKNYFELDGNQVDYYNDGQALIDEAVLHNYDIFLLDINTPKKNGLETLKYIRECNINTPAIYITAMSDIEHVKQGYDCGCNDYVRKPFILEELELRINQLIHKDCKDKIKLTDDYEFDLCNMTLYYKNESVELNTQEQNLLYLLCKNVGNTISPDVIKDYIWEEKDVCDNTLRTKIKKLRAKLQDNFIINIRNVGYKVDKK